MSRQIIIDPNTGLPTIDVTKSREQGREVDDSLDSGRSTSSSDAGSTESGKSEISKRVDTSNPQSVNLFESIEKNKVTHVLSNPSKTNIKIFSNSTSYVEKVYDLSGVSDNVTQLVVRNLPISDNERSSRSFNINVVETGQKSLLEFDDRENLIESWSLDSSRNISNDFLTELINDIVELEYRKTENQTVVLIGKIVAPLDNRGNSGLGNRGSILFEEISKNPFDASSINPSLIILSADDIVRITIAKTNDKQKRILKNNDLRDGKPSLIIDIRADRLNVNSLLNVNFESSMFEWNQLYNFRYLPDDASLAGFPRAPVQKRKRDPGLYNLNIQQIATIDNRSDIGEFADILLTEKPFSGRDTVQFENADFAQQSFQQQRNIRQLPSGKKVTLVQLPGQKTVFEKYEKLDQSLNANSDKNIFIQNFTFPTRVEFVSVLLDGKKNDVFIYNEWKNEKFNLPAAQVRFFFNDNSNIISQSSIDRLSVGERFSKTIGIDEDVVVSFTIGSFGRSPNSDDSVQRVNITVSNVQTEKDVIGGRQDDMEDRTLVLVIPKSVFTQGRNNVWKTSTLVNLSTRKTQTESPATLRRDMQSLYNKSNSVEYKIDINQRAKEIVYEFSIFFDSQ